MKDTNTFLEEHRIRPEDISIEEQVEIFTSEMIKGLKGEESSLRMIPTYIEADNEFLTGVPVVAIDAGGTNFRAAEVIFSSQGIPEISKVINAAMPGLEREISASDFFQTIADYIRPLAEGTDRIGFCFSYPSEILPDKDGRLLQFCKEVQAPEVVGQLIGRNLLETLGMQGKKIVLLNDTVATLLSGRSASLSTTYDSFIGFILGTGTNTCYIEHNVNILKNPMLKKDGSQIINIESGSFGKAPRTDLDKVFDNTTFDPGTYTFEKMFSGGYFGGLCLTVLMTAANEEVFSPKAAERLGRLSGLSSNDANNFVFDPESGDSILKECFKERQDMETCRRIVDSLIGRAAALVAANLAAVVLKTGKGKSADRPVLITIEGTTFFKLHNLKPRFESCFYGYLRGERKRYIEFTRVEKSSLIGAALAALID